MADQLQEILDVPREFLKDGIQFIKKCQKRMRSSTPTVALPSNIDANCSSPTADRREFIKISQAVGTGFLSKFLPVPCRCSRSTS
jgi:preprotein translocase subunit Sss1